MNAFVVECEKKRIFATEHVTCDIFHGLHVLFRYQ